MSWSGHRRAHGRYRRPGYCPAEPVFSHHFKMDPDTLDFEIGVPVTKPVSPAGRLKTGPTVRDLGGTHCLPGKTSTGMSWDACDRLRA